MEPCRSKDGKVTSLQCSPRPGMDSGLHSSIAILAESDQAILIFFDLQFRRPITLQEINIESFILPHLKDLSYMYCELEDQDPNRTFKVLFFKIK